MLTQECIAGSRLVEITVDGTVTKEELRAVTGACEAVIEEHGSVDILETILHVGAIEPRALWEDLVFAFHHLKDVRRCAVISSKGWIEALAKLSNPLVAAEVRFFEPEQRAEALRWLELPVSAGPARPTPSAKAPS